MPQAILSKYFLNSLRYISAYFNSCRVTLDFVTNFTFGSKIDKALIFQRKLDSLKICSFDVK